MDTWLRDLKQRREAPNEKQFKILEHVVARVTAEWLEEAAGNISRTKAEPIFDLIHGLPGTGKSSVIRWMRELFDTVLHWTHGNQYVCLAYQNSMAALVEGHTIHHWADIPVDKDKTDNYINKDISELFLRCQNLR